MYDATSSRPAIIFLKKETNKLSVLCCVHVDAVQPMIQHYEQMRAVHCDVLYSGGNE